MSITDTTPAVSDVSGFLRAARRRWWLVLLIALVGVGASAGYASRQTTVYSSYATVLVNPLGLQPTQALSSESVDLEVEEELASSYLVAEDAISRLAPDTVFADADDPARELRRSMGVRGRGDRIIELSFTHEDPAVARQVTEAYTGAYLDSRLELLTASKQEAIAALEERQAQLVLRLGTVTEELDTLEQARLAATAAAVAADEPAPPIDSRETALRFEQTQLLSRIADVDQERSELESLSSRSGEVIGPPQLPDAPANPGGVQLVIAGGVLGTLLGLALVWLLHRSAARLGSTDDLLHLAGVPVLGSVNRAASVRTAATHAPTADHAFLATTLLAQAEGLGQRRPFVITVTSPSNGDAAATTTLSLALALGAGRRVLVVSADLDDDELGLDLGLDGHPGVAAYLHGNAITPHPIADSVDVLPAGRVPDAPSLVRSPLLPQLLIELQQRYDVILVTAPGLGTRAEAAAITWLASSVLLCLDPQRDTRDRFGRAVTLLEELGTPVLGAVTVTTGRRRAQRDAAPMPQPLPTSVPAPATAPVAGGSRPVPTTEATAHDGDSDGR